MCLQWETLYYLEHILGYLILAFHCPWTILQPKTKNKFWPEEDLRLPGVSVLVKNPSVMQETCRTHGFNFWVREILWRRKRQPTPILMPGKFRRHRSLAGCSPWGHKEWDTTDHLTATEEDYWLPSNLPGKGEFTVFLCTLISPSLYAI